MYHYTESGLDNVWLVNGYTMHDTPYGKGVSIHDIDGLHRCIARLIVEKPGRLTGPEVRFLRTELGLSQKRLAQLLDVTELTAGRWERGGKPAISGPADRFLRVLYTDHACGHHDARRLVELLAELDAIERDGPQLRFEETREGWRTAA